MGGCKMWGDAMRITAACPEALNRDANQLAMALGLGPDDAGTYGQPTWSDKAGTLYAVASWVIPDAWAKAAQMPVARPKWDADEVIDLKAAARAQASMVFSPEPIPADPKRLVAVVGDDALAVLQAMGLRCVEVSE